MLPYIINISDTAETALKQKPSIVWEERISDSGAKHPKYQFSIENSYQTKNLTTNLNDEKRFVSKKEFMDVL
jgi:hypothetical protein